MSARLRRRVISGDQYDKDVGFVTLHRGRIAGDIPCLVTARRTGVLAMRIGACRQRWLR
jgi:hypothetical protein